MEQVQEKYYEMQILNSHIDKLEDNSSKVIEQIEEVNLILNSLDEMKNVKENKEILVPIANGIFAKAKTSNDDKLIVNVGQNTLVEKNIDETKELISKQLIELEEYKSLIDNELNKLYEKIKKIETEADEMVNKNV